MREMLAVPLTEMRKGMMRCFGVGIWLLRMKWILLELALLEERGH